MQAPNANLAQLWQAAHTKNRTSEKQGAQTQEAACNNGSFKNEIEQLLRADEFTFLTEAGSSLTVS